jgi:hypothetical protein
LFVEDGQVGPSLHQLLVGVAEASFDGGAVHRGAIVRTGGGHNAQAVLRWVRLVPGRGPSWVR